MNFMKMFLSFDSTFTKIAKWASFIPIACIIFIMIIASIDVITTKFFNLPIPGTSELIEQLNIPLVFMGMAYVQLERGHIVGPVLEERLSKSANRAIAIAGYIMGILVCAAISWGAILLMQNMIAIHDTKQGTLEFPLWPFALIIVLGFALITISYFISIVRAVINPESSEVNDVTQI